MNSRGKNFTEREKCKLLDLVMKFKHIIENKCTNAVSTVKKNKAWESLTSEFNSSAEIPRTPKQLSNAYFNLKRTSRKNSASENAKIYLECNKQIIQPIECTKGPSQITNSTDQSNTQITTAEMKCLLKQYKKDEIADKKGVRATGGGVYSPILSSIGAQMLAVMGDQIKPLSNNCDSASSYFINDNNFLSNQNIQTLDVLPPPSSKTSPIPHTSIATSDYVPQTSPALPKTRKVKKVIKKHTKNNELLKKKYYSTKMECALWEKKNKVLEYRMALKRQKLLDLEIKIKEKEYQNILNK